MNSPLVDQLADYCSDLLQRAAAYEALMQAIADGSWLEHEDGHVTLTVDSAAVRRARLAYHSPRPQLPNLPLTAVKA